MSTNVVKIIVRYYNREESVFIKSLDELAAWIDDFSTEHCEGSCQLYIHLDGLQRYEVVDISCEVS